MELAGVNGHLDLLLLSGNWSLDARLLHFLHKLSFRPQPRLSQLQALSVPFFAGVSFLRFEARVGFGGQLPEPQVLPFSRPP